MNLRFWEKKKPKVRKRSLCSAIESEVRKVVNVNNDERAMAVSAVYASVRILSDAVASLPLRYMRKNSNTRVFEHYTWGMGKSISYALNCKANPRMTSHQLMKGIVMQMLLNGNAYVLPTRNEVGDITEFYLISQGCCVYDEISNTYTIADSVQGISGRYTADQILHIKNTPRDGRMGVAVIEYAKDVLATAATADDVMLERFASGGIGKFVYRDKESVTGFGDYADDELKNNGEDIEQQLVYRNVAVVRGDGELTQLQMSSADLQFIQSQQQLTKAIARYFGVPPTKLFEDGSSNYKSVDAANLALYSEGLKPILSNIEAEFNAKLLNADNYLYFKFQFDIEPLYVTDSITEADYITKSIANGTLSVNDARRKKNMPPIEGGDVILVSTNLAGIQSEKIAPVADTGTRERDAKGRFVKQPKNNDKTQK